MPCNTAVSDDPNREFRPSLNAGSDWGRGNWGRHCSLKPRMLPPVAATMLQTTSISHEVTRATVTLFDGESGKDVYHSLIPPFVKFNPSFQSIIWTSNFNPFLHR
jgi:hypothetical protein